MAWFLLGIRKKEEHDFYPTIHDEGCSSLSPLAQLPIFSQYKGKGDHGHLLHSALDLSCWRG